MGVPSKQNNKADQLEEKVGIYYDDNTKLFLKLGADARTRSIHQPLYLSPGDSLEKAMHAQHDLILEYIPRSEKEFKVLDLGCGVGASMQYLASHCKDNVRFYGLTLSPKQTSIARDGILKQGRSAQLKVFTGSYLDIPADIPQVDLVYAIESVIHATDISRFFAQVAQKLRPGGKLVIFDDVMVPHPSSSGVSRILREFREGWQAYSIYAPPALARHARTAGLQYLNTRDLTRFQKLLRPRDKVVRAVVPIARLLSPYSSYCTFLVGGNARQQGYQNGILQYVQFVCLKPK